MRIIGITLPPFSLFLPHMLIYQSLADCYSFCEFRIIIQIDNSVIMPLFLLVYPHSGDYGDAITLETLKEFHRRRVQVLAEAGADLIAFETIPNKLEAQVFAKVCWFQ